MPAPGARRLPISGYARPSAGAGGRMGPRSCRPVLGAWTLISALHCRKSPFLCKIRLILLSLPPPGPAFA